MQRAKKITQEEYKALLARGKNYVPPIEHDAPPRPSKYKNQPKLVGDIWFQSSGEARRYRELLLLQAAGKISDLSRQVTFPVHVNGVKVCKYKADFTYQEGGKLVVEDYKGMPTEVYKLKKALMYACYNIEIRETTVTGG